MKKYKIFLIYFAILFCSNSIFAMETTQEEKKPISNEEKTKNTSLNFKIDDDTIKKIKDFLINADVIENDCLKYIKNYKTLETKEISFNEFIEKCEEELKYNYEIEKNVNEEKLVYIINKRVFIKDKTGNNTLKYKNLSLKFKFNSSKTSLQLYKKEIDPKKKDLKDLEILRNSEQNEYEKYLECFESICENIPYEEIFNKINSRKKHKPIKLLNKKEYTIVQFSKADFLEYIKNKIKKFL